MINKYKKILSYLWLFRKFYSFKKKNPLKLEN
jgi:hypothetical protein